MCNEITYTSPNGYINEVSEWIDTLIPHYIGIWLLIDARIKVNPC